MSTWRLQSVFEPSSIAIVGGSPRERSAGRAVMRNLRQGGYGGKIGWVSPRHRRIDGIATVRRLADLGWVPDLAHRAGPLVPGQWRKPRLGVGAALLNPGTGPRRLPRRDPRHIPRHAHRRRTAGHRLGHRINASIAARAPQQATGAGVGVERDRGALVEWGVSRASALKVSLGDALDVDFADLLDYWPPTAIRDLITSAGTVLRSSCPAAFRAQPVVLVRAARRSRRRYPEIGHARWRP